MQFNTVIRTKLEDVTTKYEKIEPHYELQNIHTIWFYGSIHIYCTNRQECS